MPSNRSPGCLSKLVHACQSCPTLTPWTAACQAPQFTGFSRQEHWSGLPCPPPGDLPNPGMEPRSPALQADSLLSEPPRKPPGVHCTLWLFDSCEPGCLTLRSCRERTQTVNADVLPRYWVLWVPLEVSANSLMGRQIKPIEIKTENPAS